MASGQARAGWDLDLKHGNMREDAIGAILRGDKTVEVKSDGKCRSTGNLFVEFRQNGMPSGIAVTTAEYWAFEYDDDSWLVIPTDKLKSIARKFYRMKRLTRGGDGNRFEGVLVPIGELVPMWTLVKK